MKTRKIAFSVFTDYVGESLWTSNSTFKASAIVSVRYKFVTPYAPDQKLAVMRPNKDIINLAVRDQDGDSGKLIWHGLDLSGRCDVFLKTPPGTACRIIGVIEIISEAAPQVDPNHRSLPAARY